MKKLLKLAGAAAMALGLSACAYDPFPSGGTTRTAVSVGYGHGHGWGGSSFSTSFFWSTGDPRWSYDPYTRAYFCNHRRAFYDPWLHGFYPVGFRPPIIVGVPHPVGYRQGWCPPPRNVTNVTIVNYNNRKEALRRTNHSWARNVRMDSNQHRHPTARRQQEQIQQQQARGGRGSTANANDRNNRNPGWDGRGGTNRAQNNARDTRNNSWNRGQDSSPFPGRATTPTPAPRQNAQPQRPNAQPQRPNAQPQRITPSRQPVASEIRGGTRAVQGNDPMSQNRGNASRPQPQRQEVAPRGGRQPQAAPAPAPRGHEQAARPPQRSNTNMRQPTQPQRGDSGRGGLQGRSGSVPGPAHASGGNRGGRGNR